MSSVIYTNMASQVAQKNLLGAQNALATSVERLSSGLRINRARDDAAGLSVANSLTSQINGANQGIRNLNDAISMVQTAEGAITAASDMGQRILTLATQAANNTLSTAARTAINNEMKELVSAINSIGSRTKYAGNSLLVNSLDAVDTPSATGTQFSMQISNDSSDKILLLVAAFRSIGTTGVDTDVNATDNGQAAVLSAAIDAANTADSYGAVQSAATNYVAALDTQRSLLGAYQNRLEYTLSNITSLSTNLTASRSRVIDTDYASETADLTRNQILQQAATAMLAQANQMPNVILTLLK
jgi:flagellin